ncbi:MAG: EAL domain-containing protein [Aestuariibacter sp.]
MAENASMLVVTASAERYQKIRSKLKNQFRTIEHASDSGSAISKLKIKPFECIVSDTEIGDIDAWRLVRMLRANLFVTDADAPFILISDTYCEHIAQTTAAAFAIDQVVAQDHLDELPSVVEKHSLASQTGLNKPAVLVIEDDHDISELASRLLKVSYRVETADTGTRGLDKYLNGQFDIVLLDVQLPEMSGHQVLDAIMAHNPQQAVVIMTAHGGTDVAEELLIKGAVDFIPKPFKGDQLRAVIAIAAQRENYLISNSQFEDKVLTIEQREHQYKELSEAHTRLLNHLSTVVMELDGEGRIKFVNRAWRDLTGYRDSETIGELLESFGYGDDGETTQYVRHHLDKVISGEVDYNKIEYQVSTKSLSSIWVEVQFNDLHRHGELVGVTVTMDNIDDRKKAELELSHLASHDTLTNLFNRHYFDSELRRLADTALINKHTHCLLYLDLDHFKVINDTQGHHQGDQVIKDVADKLLAMKREGDVYCRVGGDEFALLLPRTELADAEQFAQRICTMLQNGHYQFDDRIFKISCSIGMTEISGVEILPETYLQQADIALYVAKRRGRNQVHTYGLEDRDTEDFKASVQWVHILQKAIVNDQLILHFQPVFDAVTGSVAYFEALVRLVVDDRIIMPGEFIPALERVEDTNLLDHQVVSKAISMISEFDVLEKVAINLSAQAFSDDNLLPLVQEKLAQYGVSAGQIIFEVTESASLTNLDATRGMINKLMELGCEFSIDDFGTGFSTFSYLKQLPANSVKIDGSFVKDMVENPIDKALVKSICEVATALQKTTVAEFVENEQTAVALRALGVDYLQGYHLSRPLDIKTTQETYAEAV